MPTMRRVFLYLGLLVRFCCDGADNPRVFDGTSAKLGEFKSAVHIHVQVSGSGGSWTKSCTGTIISPRYVLTAASCIYKYIVQSRQKVEAQVEVTVRAGTLTSSDDAATPSVVQKRTADKTRLFYHPKAFERDTDDADVSTEYDATLVEMEPAFTFGENVASTPLMTKKLPAGKLFTECAGLGFGVQGGSSGAAAVLGSVQVVAGTREFCAALGEGRGLATKVCAMGDGTVETCGGDVGSALMCRLSGGVEVGVGVLSGGRAVARRRDGGCSKADKGFGVYLYSGAIEIWLRKTTNFTDEVKFISWRAAEGGVQQNAPSTCVVYVLTFVVLYISTHHVYTNLQ